MPTTSAAVGGLTLPLPAGVAGQRIDDPAVSALLDFAAYTIKRVLDARLANLTGTSADAVPAANRFAFNPTEPRGHQIHLPVPSLFCWWEGTSKRRDWSLVHRARERSIWVMYVFDELPQLDEMDRRQALFNAVDAALHVASDRQRDPAFGFDSDPLGTPLWQSLSATYGLRWEYDGGFHGRFGIDEGPPELTRRTIKRQSARDYPAIKGSFTVLERVEQDTMNDPADVARDIAGSIRVSDGDGVGARDYMDRVLGAPDGSEDLDDG